MMGKKHNPDRMLLELTQLDKRLINLQKFFQKTKTTVIEDSLFTPQNIEEAIQLLQKINPSEKAMIQTLKLLLPMAKQGKNIMNDPLKSNHSLSLPTKTTSAHTSCTSKLKRRTMPNRMI